jgi:VCBS repeat-containing protein
MSTQALLLAYGAGNQAPSITSANTFSVAENTTTIATLTATDPNVGDTLTWSITGGADSALFTLNSSTGALAFATPKDYDVPTDAGGNNVYDVTVQVSDGSLTASQNIAVTVTNVNEAPTITSSSSISIVENTTAVGTLTATDPDAGTTKTWSIIGGADQALFSLNSSTGALTFITAPDYETPTDADHNNVYVVQVQVSDGSLTANQTINVTVSDDVSEGSHLYWRLSFVDDGGYGSMAECVMKTTSGGSQAATGGTATASTTNTTGGGLTFAASKAFDGSTATFWATSSDGSSGGPHWLAYQFASAVNIVEVTLTSRPDSFYNETPKRFALQYSDDGTTWYSKAYFITTSWTSSTQSRTFTVPSNTGAATNWTIWFDVLNAGSVNHAIAEIEYHASIGGADITSPTGTVATNSTGAFHTAIEAFDNNTGTYYSTSGPNLAYMNYTFPSAVQPVEMTIRSLASGTELPPKQFAIATTSDFLSWAVRYVSPVQSAWTNSEVRTYLLPYVAYAAPSITSSSTVSVVENTTAVLTLTASGSGPMAWSITGGADSAKFSVSSTTGVLTFATAPDYESPTDANTDNVYVVTVQASDGTNTASQTINVTVTDYNEVFLSRTDRNKNLLLSSSALTVSSGVARLGVAINRTSGKVWFYNPNTDQWNGAAIGSQNPATATGGYTFTPSGALFPMIGLFGTASGRMFGGAAGFAHVVPSGFTAWDTLAGSTLAVDNGNKGANITVTSGLASNATAAWNSIKGTSSLSSGLAYFEVETTSFDGSSGLIIGLGNTTASTANYPGSDTNSFGVQAQGSGYQLAGGAGTFIQSATSNFWKTVRATIGHSTGKYYFEVTITAAGDLAQFILGIVDGSASIANANFVGSDTHGYGLQPGSSSGQLYNNGAGSTSKYGTASVGQVVGVAVDFTNSKVSFLNVATGQWLNDVIGNQNPATNTGGLSISGLSGSVYPAASFNRNSGLETLTFNFGATAFSGSAPSGFTTW